MNRLFPRHAFVRLVLIATVIVALDQYTKYLTVHYFKYGETLPVIPGLFNLTLAYNKGAAFGMFGGLNDGVREIVLFVVTLIAFGVVVFFMRTEEGKTPAAQLAFGLIVGGAIGNVIDRVRLGMVVDFLDFYVGSYHWPAFNIADSAICVGVGTLLLFSGKRHASSDSPAAQ